jgi:pyrroloquinoline quinone biosynthesis protein B
MIEAIVLGSAAGAGFPQWNSNAPACRRARRGDAAAARSQASIAVSGNRRDWFIVTMLQNLVDKKVLRQ